MPPGKGGISDGDGDMSWHHPQLHSTRQEREDKHSTCHPPRLLARTAVHAAAASAPGGEHATLHAGSSRRPTEEELERRGRQGDDSLLSQQVSGRRDARRTNCPCAALHTSEGRERRITGLPSCNASPLGSNAPAGNVGKRRGDCILASHRSSKRSQCGLHMRTVRCAALCACEVREIAGCASHLGIQAGSPDGELTAKE